MNECVPRITAARTAGAPFVVGEFDSVGCSGMQNVSNTFGQTFCCAGKFLTYNLLTPFDTIGSPIPTHMERHLTSPECTHTRVRTFIYDISLRFHPLS